MATSDFWIPNCSWLCCWFVVSHRQILIIQYRYTLILQDLGLNEQLHSPEVDVCILAQSTSNLSLCRVGVWACYMSCETLCYRDTPPVSGCHGDLKDSPGVVFHGVLLVVLLYRPLLSRWEFWEVLSPGDSLPVRFPVCLALHSPPDGKCLLLITHRWTQCTEKCVYMCVF